MASATPDTPGLSSYALLLPEEAKARYKEKIKMIGSFDPFVLPDSGSCVTPADLPPVEASDLVSYLVLQTSYLTTKQFKAHKSLEAYNQFVNGWVKDVHSWQVADKIIVTGRVRTFSNILYCPLYIYIYIYIYE